MNGGAANVILDNLIASGKAVPMVVVTTLGYGVNNGPAGAMAPESITGYTKILLTEVMPAVEKAYNVSRNREERAIAGLSMGGAETLYTGLNNLDKFAWIGVVQRRVRDVAGCDAAGATRGRGSTCRAASARHRRRRARRTRPRRDARARRERVREEFPGARRQGELADRMLWITCGTADSLIGVNRQFKDWLKSKNVKFTEEEVPDMGHVWPLWRKNLADFAQKAFQKS